MERISGRTTELSNVGCHSLVLKCKQLGGDDDKYPPGVST